MLQPSEVLEILFQFVYPERRKKISDVDPLILADVAEATEKYQMYTAMDACEIRLE